MNEPNLFPGNIACANEISSVPFISGLQQDVCTTSAQPITILFADNQRLIRETMAMLLEADPRFILRAVCPSGDATVYEASRQRVEVVIAAVDLKDCGGVEAILRIRSECPGTAIIAMIDSDRISIRHQLLAAGVTGLVSKKSSYLDLTDAVLCVSKGKKFICPELKNIIAGQALALPDRTSVARRLTKKQADIAVLLNQGFTVDEIAAAKNICVRTVKDHRNNIHKQTNP